ncbi:MAG: hypothetical protein OHK0039_01430 [Bacteroidia bacterium]
MDKASKRVLLVEDDDVNQLIATHILAKAGIIPETADNGQAAVDRIRTEAYDLILMDIEMPIMGGLEATQLIRQMDLGRNVPIVAMTAHSFPEKLAEIHAAGMNDFIIKPFDRAKVQQIFDKYL